jgi:hypothetical protein
VDVNGAELGVIRENLLPLLTTRRIAHLVCEFNPKAWQRFNRSAQTADGAELIYHIARHGYRVGLLPFQRHRATWFNTSTVKRVLDTMLNMNERDVYFERI